MRPQQYGYAALITFCLGMAPVAQAELKPISESAMGDVTGQAFMQVENITGTTYEFTRMTLGVDVETRVNIDDVQVGQGVFINLPTNMAVDLENFINGGVDRLRTHRVDMGTNLF